MKIHNMLPAVRSLMILLSAGCLCQSSAHSGQFKTGAAQVDITPRIGTPRGGGYATITSVGVLDPLHAKAIVVEQDGAKAAFVGLDVCYTIRPVITAARKLIAEQCGIPPERVMISATHTHSGPVQTRCNLMDVITGADKPVALEYTAKLPSLIAQAVAEANAKLTPARASAMMAQENHVSFNRRYWMQDGSLGWMTARSPDMVRPAGPIDPDVGVCYFESAEKKNVPLEAEVQAIAFSNDLAIVALAGEIFVELGLALKKASPFQHTFIAELANGSIGYVPNKSAYPEGNYEVVSARCAEGSGEMLVNAAVKMLQELRPQN